MSQNPHEDRGELGGFPKRAEDRGSKSVFNTHPQDTQPVKKEEVVEYDGNDQESKPDTDQESKSPDNEKSEEA